jgi:hypothetical protein
MSGRTPCCSVLFHVRVTNFKLHALEIQLDGFGRFLCRPVRTSHVEVVVGRNPFFLMLESIWANRGFDPLTVQPISSIRGKKDAKGPDVTPN